MRAARPVAGTRRGITLLAALCVCLVATPVASAPAPPGGGVAASSPSYCATRPSVSRARLYDEPPCDLRTTQRPRPSEDVEWRGYQLANLSFCCNANYTALLPVGTNVTAKDEEARWLFQSVEMLVRRLDCGAFYPLHSCTPCLDAYRTWLCATMFPMKCLGDTVALQICNDVCLEVHRKCPTEVGFACPLDSGTRDEGDGIYGAWGAGTNIQLFGAGGCNPMHYNLGQGSPYASNDGSAAAARRAPFWAAAMALLLTIVAVS